MSKVKPVKYRVKAPFRHLVPSGAGTPATHMLRSRSDGLETTVAARYRVLDMPLGSCRSPHIAIRRTQMLGYLL